MEDLTSKQYELYLAIKYYIEKYGFSPSIRDLCKIVCNNSPATVLSKLKMLKKKGYISYIPDKNRTIRIIK